MRTLGKAFEVINRKKSYVNFPYLMKVEPPPKIELPLRPFWDSFQLLPGRGYPIKHPILLLPEEYRRGFLRCSWE